MSNIISLSQHQWKPQGCEDLICECGCTGFYVHREEDLGLCFTCVKCGDLTELERM